MKNRNKKIFVGGLDLDDAPRFVGQMSYLNAENIRVTTSADGTLGNAEGLLSTRQPAVLATSYTIPPDGTNKVIGRYVDVEKNRVIYFVHNTPLAEGRGSHHILVYSKSEDSVRLAFHDSLMSSASPNVGLNWQATEQITGVALIGELLFWVDSNGPRQFNLERGIKKFYPSYTGADTALPNGLRDTDIKVIRKPPNYPPNWIWSQNSAFKGNQLKGKQFKFALRYKYTDGQVSVLSPHSLLADWNAKYESMIYKIDYNTLVVTPSVNESIPPDVAEIQFLAKEGNLDWMVIESLTVGTMPMQMVFAHDRLGATISPEQATKLFDAVPIASAALEVATGRLFLGNNLHGYEKSPYPASMEITTPTYIEGNTGISGTYVVVWSLWDDDPNDQYPAANEFTKVLIKVDNHPGYNGYYEMPIPTYVAVDPTASPMVQNYSTLPATVFVAGASPVLPLSASNGDLIDYCNGPGYTGVMDDSAVEVLNTAGGYPTVPLPIITGLVTTANAGVSFPTGERVAKTGGKYKGGIVFYDQEMRTNGVITPVSHVATVAERDFGFGKLAPGVAWEIIPQIADEVSAANRIPNWAHYYSVVRTRDLTRSYFVQGLTSTLSYATTDDAGAYVIDTTSKTWTSSITAIAIDVTTLYNRGTGYSFNSGDMCLLTRSNNAQTLHEVVGTQGKYVLLSPKNIGQLSNASFIFEIYTPYKEGSNELYYEFGQVFPVSQPGTIFKNYSQFSGILPGDIYVKNVDGIYWVESYSPSAGDDLGLVDDAGRALIKIEGEYGRRTVEVAYSNTIIQGASVNNICKFDALDVSDDVDVQSGPIRHLVLVNKTQGSGNVMLAICESDTVSLYLGENILSDNQGDEFLSRTAGVIGAARPLRGGYGTINPESIVEYSGNIYWLDAVRKCVVRYNNNGLFPVSSYKVKDFFNSRGEYVQDNPLSVVPGGYDPQHDEYIITLPGDNTSPVEYLEDIVRETASFDFGGTSFQGEWGADLCALDEQDSITFAGTWAESKCVLDTQDNTFSGTWADAYCRVATEVSMDWYATWAGEVCGLYQDISFIATWYRDNCTIFPLDYPQTNFITNGTFDSLDNWSLVTTSGAGWQLIPAEGFNVNGSYLSHTADVSGTIDSFEQLFTVQETGGELYRIRIDANVTVGDLRIYRLTSGADVLVRTISAPFNGTDDFKIDPSGDFKGIRVECNYDAAATVDNLRLSR